jgi:hypothetical protein
MAPDQGEIMKYVKMLALAAVAAGALMAFIGAGTASATELCSTTTAAGACPAGQKVTGNLKFTLASGTSALLKETGAEGGTLDTCKGSEVAGEITNSGSATTTVTGKITSLTWSTCSFTTTTTLKGGLECHRIAGTSNCTLTADGPTKVTINTVFFGSCVYTVTEGESIGDLTEGNPAVFHANAIAHKQEGSNFACPATSVWTATYTLTSPATTVSAS